MIVILLVSQIYFTVLLKISLNIYQKNNMCHWHKSFIKQKKRRERKEEQELILIQETGDGQALEM